MSLYARFRDWLHTRLVARYRRHYKRIYTAPLPKPVPDSRSSIDTFARIYKQRGSR